MTPLEEVLSGRDERAAWQNFWISKTRGAYSKTSRGASAYFVVQIGLNVPCYPKRVPHDIDVIRKCRKFLLGCANALPEEEQYLENGAGVCWQGAFDAERYSAEKLKRIAIDTENTMTAGRALDIDVITDEGPISRTWMGLPPRRCLVCGEDAKLCAKAGRHDPQELRELVARLVAEDALYM